MNKPVFRVIGLEQATCQDAYCGCVTQTRHQGESNTDRAPQSRPNETVTIKLRDILPAVLAISARQPWIEDFAEDPVVVTHDFYEVLLTYQSLRRAG